MSWFALFLIARISGDPCLSFRRPFLSWIRKEYIELNKMIQEEIEAGMYSLFIVLGTPGCGKSVYAVQFALEAAHRGRILFKKGEAVYIVDGVRGVAEGPYSLLSDEIQGLLADEESWLVIDGRQEEVPFCECRVLVVCSRAEYNQGLGKLEEAVTLYMSPWFQAAVEEFIRDFEPHRAEYPRQRVPSLNKALEVFHCVAGLARYVLQEAKMEDGLERWRRAIQVLASDVNAGTAVLGGWPHHDVHEIILHMFATDEQRWWREEFASEQTVRELHEAYLKAGLAQTGALLERTDASSRVAAPLRSKLFRSVVLLQMKLGKVLLECKDGRQAAVAPGRHKLVKFASLGELKALLDGDTRSRLLCCLSTDCLQVADAAMTWKKRVVLLRVWKLGGYGVDATGLELVDCVLSRPVYELWYCVPVDFYARTGSQPYIGSSAALAKVVQRVVQVDYRWHGSRTPKQRCYLR